MDKMLAYLYIKQFTESVYHKAQQQKETINYIYKNDDTLWKYVLK